MMLSYCSGTVNVQVEGTFTVEFLIESCSSFVPKQVIVLISTAHKTTYRPVTVNFAYHPFLAPAHALAITGSKLHPAQ
jgi:hypothetical protein